MSRPFAFIAQPLADPAAVIAGDTWRFTVLTPAMIRVEYDAQGQFTDLPTQTVMCRRFPVCDFTQHWEGSTLVVETEKLLLTYTGGPFTDSSLTIQVKASLHNERNIWHFGETPRQPLWGTTRTLDRIDGACVLDHGLFSMDGWEVLDDSKTLLRTEDDWIKPRPAGLTDLYFFGYDREYRQCIKDFYHLTGATPMLPRFAFGNWWSRYYEYSQESYLKLMDRFRQEQVPFSVAVIDMDWHITKIDPKFGIGWTGYTWNKELFPDHVAFLKELRSRGMRTTLNLHPADGIRSYEQCYPIIAKHMGVDQQKGEKVAFDATSRKFLKYYFEDVLHPMEDEGVDFWWIDWQQGTATSMAGLDPLWMLNHFHFLDSGRDGKRPMTFSRYAGPGSHRYPVGFSGDTIVTWDSLDFQPYFTSNADNIGYGWWSHDIGGHMNGIKDDELYGRWVQYGVFSPICRLHSTKNEFNGREPWRYRADVCQMAERFLRLRHRLVPYLYTMNHRAWAEGEPLCQPMYYTAPTLPEARQVPNEYTFGTAMVCAPITQPAAPHAPACVKVWLPKGQWTDFFTGLTYQGGRTVDMYRSIESFPVLAKAGALIPLADDAQADVAKNPEAMTLRVYPGADGAFTLYEDDSETTDYLDGVCALTALTYREDAAEVHIAPAAGNVEVLPAQRTWTLEIPGVCRTSAVCHVDGKQVELTTDYDEEASTLTVHLPACAVTADVTVTFPEGLHRDKSLPLRYAHRLLDKLEMPFDEKRDIYRLLVKAPNAAFALSQLLSQVKDPAILGAIAEVVITMD